MQSEEKGFVSIWVGNFLINLSMIMFFDEDFSEALHNETSTNNLGN